RVVDERLLRALRAEGLVEGLAHGVQVDQGGVQFLRRPSDSLGVIAEAIGDLALRVEGPAVHRGDEYRSGPMLAGLVGIMLERLRIGCERPNTFPALLLIVVPELD